MAGPARQSAKQRHAKSIRTQSIGPPLDDDVSVAGSLCPVGRYSFMTVGSQVTMAGKRMMSTSPTSWQPMNSNMPL